MGGKGMWTPAPTTPSVPSCRRLPVGVEAGAEAGLGAPPPPVSPRLCHSGASGRCLEEACPTSRKEVTQARPTRDLLRQRDDGAQPWPRSPRTPAPPAAPGSGGAAHSRPRAEGAPCPAVLPGLRLGRRVRRQDAHRASPGNKAAQRGRRPGPPDDKSLPGPTFLRGQAQTAGADPTVPGALCTPKCTPGIHSCLCLCISRADIYAHQTPHHPQLKQDSLLGCGDHLNPLGPAFGTPEHHENELPDLNIRIPVEVCSKEQVLSTETEAQGVYTSTSKHTSHMPSEGRNKTSL
ncbi:translation initiation factor IF-2-like [Canis lupus familiaris]|uniref:translation initiation factor IF-2-like n=1 Tax=Canis lupus familiaris TaxID=9615 RepID=UPI0018F5E988|nr:translation initiation factor IF-2-like [Canis lupus familiaris]XP_038435164.1 translation initiation factor IF-2-like [Canis lupus familiaris]